MGNPATIPGAVRRGHRGGPHRAESIGQIDHASAVGKQDEAPPPEAVVGAGGMPLVGHPAVGAIHRQNLAVGAAGLCRRVESLYFSGEILEAGGLDHHSLQGRRSPLQEGEGSLQQDPGSRSVRSGG